MARLCGIIGNQQQGTKQMFGIALVAILISFGPICQYVLETYFPVPPLDAETHEPVTYFGPSRRLFEVAQALA